MPTTTGNPNWWSPLKDIVKWSEQDRWVWNSSFQGLTSLFQENALTVSFWGCFYYFYSHGAKSAGVKNGETRRADKGEPNSHLQGKDLDFLSLLCHTNRGLSCQEGEKNMFVGEKRKLFNLLILNKKQISAEFGPHCVRYSCPQKIKSLSPYSRIRQHCSVWKVPVRWTVKVTPLISFHGC